MYLLLFLDRSFPAGGQTDAAQAHRAAHQHESGREHSVRSARHGRHAHHHRAHHTARAQSQVQNRHEQVFIFCKSDTT